VPCASPQLRKSAAGGPSLLAQLAVAAIPRHRGSSNVVDALGKNRPGQLRGLPADVKSSLLPAAVLRSGHQSQVRVHLPKRPEPPHVRYVRQEGEHGQGRHPLAADRELHLTLQWLPGEPSLANAGPRITPLPMVQEESPNGAGAKTFSAAHRKVTMRMTRGLKRGSVQRGETEGVAAACTEQKNGERATVISQWPPPGHNAQPFKPVRDSAELFRGRRYGHRAPEQGPPSVVQRFVAHVPRNLFHAGLTRREVFALIEGSRTAGRIDPYNGVAPEIECVTLRSHCRDLRPI